MRLVQMRFRRYSPDAQDTFYGSTICHFLRRASIYALVAPGPISTVGPNLLRSRSFTRLSHFARQHHLFPSELLTGATRGVAIAILRRQFSYSFVNMTATKIDGTAIARRIRESLSAQIKKQQETDPEFKPSLTIIQGECGKLTAAGCS